MTNYQRYKVLLHNDLMGSGNKIASIVDPYLSIPKIVNKKNTAYKNQASSEQEVKQKFNIDAYFLALQKAGCSQTFIEKNKDIINEFIKIAKSKHLKINLAKPKYNLLEQLLEENSFKKYPLNQQLQIIKNLIYYLKNKTLPLNIVDKVIANKTSSKPITLQIKEKNFDSSKATKTQKMLLPYFNTGAIIIFFLGLLFFGFKQFIQNAGVNLAFFPNTSSASRAINFQGRITDDSGIAISGSLDMKFRIYEAITGGTDVWDSDDVGTCTVTADSSGIFSVGLGDDCGPDITETIFNSQNGLWLEIEVYDSGDSVWEILTPRQPIRVVAFAMNSASLQGYTPGNPTSGILSDEVIVTNASGQLILASNNTMIQSTSGTFTIEGNSSLTLQTSGTNAHIFLIPNGSGNVGIGTTTPSAKLDVLGGANIDSLTINNLYTLPRSDGANGQYLQTDGAGNLTWSIASGSLDTDWAINGSDMYANVSGNVGVDTNSPSTGFDVGGGSYSHASGSNDVGVEGDLEVLGTIYGNIDADSISLNGTLTVNNIDATSSTIDNLYSTNISTNTISADTYSTNFAEGSVVFIDLNGNLSTDTGNFYWDNTNDTLGIGTSTPNTSYSLDVVGDAHTSGGIIIGNTTSATLGAMRWTGTDFEGLTGSGWASFTSGGSTLWLQNGSDIGYLTGNVGIGTTTPSVGLDIGGGIYSNLSTANDVGIAGDLEVLGTIFGTINSSGTLSADIINTNTITVNNIDASTMTVNYFDGDVINASTITVNNIDASTMTVNYFDGDVINANTITVNNIDASTVSITDLTVTSSTINNLTTNTISADYLTINEINATSSTIDNLYSSNITTNTISADNFNTNFTQGSVLFIDSSGNLATDTGNFFWDNTNDILGIGTSTPNTSYSLDVVGDMHASGGIILGTTTSTTMGAIRWTGADFEGYSTTGWVSLTSGTSGPTLWVQNGTDIGYIAGNVGIGTTTPTVGLDVGGGTYSISDVDDLGVAGDLEVLGTIYGTINTTGTMSADNITVNNINASTITVNNIDASTVSITDLTVTSSTINNLFSNTISADYLTINEINATSSTIDNLYTTNINTNTISADNINTNFTQGSVIFIDSSGNLATDTGNFFWDDTNDILGIGTSLPNISYSLDVVGDIHTDTTVWANAFSSNSPLRLQTNGTDRIYVNDVSGNVGIGTTAPGYLFDVAGNASLDSLNINGAYTLPTTDSTTTGYVMKTNGAGVLSWQADKSGFQYIVDSNTEVDFDGTSTNGVGSYPDSVILESTVLTSVDSADRICTNSLTAPTKVVIENDDDCTAVDAGDSHIIGSYSSAGEAPLKAGSTWGYRDTDADGYYDLGEDLFILDSQGNYKTLQAAIDAAVTGDSIFVRHGNYYENVTLSGKTLKITGESATETAIVAAAATAALTLQNSAVFNEISSIGFTNIDVATSTSYCIRLTSDSVDNNTFKNIETTGGYVAIVTAGADGTIITNSYLHDARSIIATDNSAQDTNWVITNNTFSTTTNRAIENGYSDHKWIITGNTFNSVYIAVDTYGAGHIVANNVINTTTNIAINATGPGPLNSGENCIQVMNNYILSSGSHSINIGSCTGAVVTGNEIHTSGADGIVMDDANFANVSNNVIRGSTSDGIVITGGSNNSNVSNNIFHTITGDCIYIASNTTQSIVNNNNFYSCGTEVDDRTLQSYSNIYGPNLASTIDIMTIRNFLTNNGVSIESDSSATTGYPLIVKADTYEAFSVNSVGNVNLPSVSLISNPLFDENLSDYQFWSKVVTGGGNWSQNTGGDGRAAYTGGASQSADLYQSIKMTAGHRYLVNYNIYSITANASLTPYVGGTAGTTVTTSGDKSEIIVAGSSNTNFLFRGASTAATQTIYVENIFVYDLDAKRFLVANDFAIKQDGNVGIGTTAPAYDLDVMGNMRLDGFYYDENNSAGTPGQVLSTTATGTDWVNAITAETDPVWTAAEPNYLRSNTSDSYTSGTLTFNSGTTLDINGDLSITDTSIVLDGATSNFSVTGNFSINTNDLFIEKSSGNVGIGTTAPSTFLLEVNGDIGPAITPTVETISQSQVLIDDSAAYIGLNSHMIIDPAGLPFIAYNDGSNSSLKTAKCTNTDCSSTVTIETVDNSFNTGTFNDVIFGSDNLPIIAYTENTLDQIRIAKCNNSDCSDSSTYTIDSATDYVNAISIINGRDNLPIIAYKIDDSLTVAKCVDTNCTSVTTTSIDNTNLYDDPKILIGIDGYPIINYLQNGSVKVAKCSNSSCSATESITTLDTYSTAGATTMAIGSDGLPIVAYCNGSTDGQLRVAKCSNINCTATESITTVYEEGPGGLQNCDPNIVIGTDDLPIISLHDYGNSNLIISKCLNQSCSDVKTTTNSSTDFEDSWMKIGLDGLPIISYLDTVTDDLWVLKCASQDCANTTGSYFSGGINLGSQSKYFNNAYAVNYWAKEGMAIANFDLAEDYTISGAADFGDIVSIKSNAKDTATLSTSAYQDNLLGIVSTKPGIRLSEWDNPQQAQKPIAIAGRVPMKVVSLNGHITAGDHLTSSDIKGLGMKTTASGMSIGTALEDSNFETDRCHLVSSLDEISWPDDDGTNQIKPCFKVPVASLEEDIQNNLMISYNLNETDYFYLTKVMTFVNVSWYQPEALTLKLEKLLNNYQVTTDGQLQVNKLIASEIIANTLSIESLTATTLSVDTASIDHLEVKEELVVQGPLTTDLITANSINTHTLTADHLSTDTLSARSAVLGEATISGKLYAEQIDGLQDKLRSSLEDLSLFGASNAGPNLGEIENNLTKQNLYLASNLQLDISDLDLSKDDIILSPAAAYLNKYLEVNGNAYIAASLGVEENILIGTGMSINQDGITHTSNLNITANKVQINPTGNGSLAMMADSLVINETGKVQVNGDLTVSGKITTKDLETETSVSENSTVKENIQILGSVSIGQKIELASAEASDSAEVVTNKSTGQAIIEKNSNTTTIKSSLISKDSLIYITPVSDTLDKVIYVSEQMAENPETKESEGFFTVKINTAIEKDITFNWWIIN